LWLAARLVPPGRRDEVQGDLVELWRLRSAEPRRWPRAAFWRDVWSLTLQARRARRSSPHGSRDSAGVLARAVVEDTLRAARVDPARALR
jgi:hypothetical protein